MNKKKTTAFAAFIACAALSGVAGADNHGNALAGSWVLVTNTTDPAGKKTPTLGSTPRGTLIFAPDGRYTLFMARAGLPRFASNSRERGTDDENRAIVSGTLAHAGTYSVDERAGTFTWKIEASSFPNWENTVHVRQFRIVGNELQYRNPAAQAGAGAPEAVWRRAK